MYSYFFLLLARSIGDGTRLICQVGHRRRCVRQWQLGENISQLQMVSAPYTALVVCCRAETTIAEAVQHIAYHYTAGLLLLMQIGVGCSIRSRPSLYIELCLMCNVCVCDRACASICICNLFVYLCVYSAYVIEDTTTTTATAQWLHWAIIIKKWKMKEKQLYRI